jgi:glutathione synthase/RimK-type ligase-like ATP-grasp enzyme
MEMFKVSLARTRVALVTAAAARDQDEDLAPLEAALRAQGAEVSIVDWDDPGISWGRFEVALLRSTWDYSMRLPQFLRWAEEVSRLTLLLNPLEVVRWNTDKHYLAELERAQVPIVPSHFIEPAAERGEIEAYLDALDAPELVVKPAIGSGSRDAQRHDRSAREPILSHILRLTAAGRTALLQPYLERVDDHGETALMFFRGRFSHAIRKGPLLRAGADPTDKLFATEEITRRVPDADELRVGALALDAIPFADLLYARVDLVRDSRGAPCVLELELTEPSLFFSHDPASAPRFVAQLADFIPPHLGRRDEASR